MGLDVLAESDLSGTLTDEYVFFDNQRIARRNVSSGDIFYYSADHLGTSRAIVKQGDTSPCYNADFYPYGGERAVTNTCSQRYKFTSQERDTESSLDYFNARHYPSWMGRFLQPDLPFADQNVSDPQTWNLYTYVHNNPLFYVDPTGLHREQKCSVEPLPENDHTQDDPRPRSKIKCEWVEVPDDPPPDPEPDPRFDEARLLDMNWFLGLVHSVLPSRSTGPERSKTSVQEGFRDWAVHFAKEETCGKSASGAVLLWMRDGAIKGTLYGLRAGFIGGEVAGGVSGIPGALIGGVIGGTTGATGGAIAGGAAAGVCRYAGVYK